MKFELSIFVIWSGPVDKVAFFQIEIFQIEELEFYGSNPASAHILKSKVFLKFLYSVLQGDNFLAGYFYIFFFFFWNLFFYSGFLVDTASFPSNKNSKGIYM